MNDAQKDLLIELLKIFREHEKRSFSFEFNNLDMQIIELCRTIMQDMK
jgi:hypothetical protein